MTKEEIDLKLKRAVECGDVQTAKEMVKLGGDVFQGFWYLAGNEEMDRFMGEQIVKRERMEKINKIDKINTTNGS
jgi:hypothetical protein